MKRLLTALLASSAILFSVPAFATDQYEPNYSYQGGYGGYSGYSGYPGNWNTDWARDNASYYTFQREIRHLAEGIEHGLRDGSFDRWEARRFLSQVRSLKYRLDSYYGGDGISPWERRDLQRRIRSLHRGMHAAHDEGHDNYGYGYGYGGPYGDGYPSR